MGAGGKSEAGAVMKRRLSIKFLTEPALCGFSIFGGWNDQSEKSRPPALSRARLA